MYYPLFLSLERAHCLIVGAGEVGLRKAHSLLECGPASLLVLDVTAPGSAWEKLRTYPALRTETRAFTPDDVVGKALAFACTGSREANAAVVRACAAQGVLCNCVDAPLEGSFIVPATARARHVPGNDALSGEAVELSAALSTGGGSPAWARVLKQELEDWLAPRLPMTVLLARLRPLVLALGDDTGQNTAIFRSLARSGLREALGTDPEASRRMLREALPEALHPHIPELLYDLI